MLPTLGLPAGDGVCFKRFLNNTERAPRRECWVESCDGRGEAWLEFADVLESMERRRGRHGTSIPLMDGDV